MSTPRFTLRVNLGVDISPISAYDIREVGMRFAFRSKRLELLYREERGKSLYPTGVVQAFFEAMAAIEAAADERDLYALKSLRFERLRGEPGKRGHRSLRLNDQYRLILSLDKDEEGALVWLISVKKHYR